MRRRAQTDKAPLLVLRGKRYIVKVTSKRILIVDGNDEINLGEQLRVAAEKMGHPATLCNKHIAYRSARPIKALFWRFLDHRPVHLGRFTDQVLRTAAEFKPDLFIGTGFTPVSEKGLQQMGRWGITRVNFLCDDPWSPGQRADWFFRAIRHYDHLFSPRQASLADLKTLGPAPYDYLPFGYSPHLHFPEPLTPAERASYQSDVFFGGGADADRVPYLSALAQAGLKLALYGQYWERFPETRPYARGQAPLSELRKATAGTQIALGLVRQANRDGHSMRTFEIPAMGACLLMEKTDEHVAIFGEEGKNVRYFSNPAELVKQSRYLMENPAERARLKTAAHHLILTTKNTYDDRLEKILQLSFQRQAVA